MCDLRHRTNVVFDKAIVATLQRADIDHHVDFRCAVEDRAARFVSFDVRKRSAEWKADDSTNRNAAADQITSSDAHPGRIHANGSEAISRSFVTQLLNIVVGSFRLEERVIDEACPFPGGPRLSQHETDAGSSRVDDAVHALGATMKALRRATAHRR